MIIITGAAAAGKSTVTRLLKEYLPKEKFDIHDIDESDKWTNSYEAWRDAKVEYWLRRSVGSKKAGITTILCGIIYPENVRQGGSYKAAAPVRYFLLDVTPEVLTQRYLSKVGSKEEKLTGKAEPGTRVERGLKRQIEITAELRQAYKNVEHAHIIDTNDTPARVIAESIEKQLLAIAS